MKVDIIYTKNSKIPSWLIEEVKGNKLLATILFERGFDTPDKVRQFLTPELYQPTDPVDFPGMNEAVELIIKSVQNKQKTCIYGDYDVDGVTATTILVNLIKLIGGEVIYHLPNRFTEGYGMNQAVIRELSEQVDLIITCDCGISNHQEIALAKSLGLTVIVTDHHHLPQELPPADVIVSPKLLADDHPAQHIPGAGMTYYLAQAVLAAQQRQNESQQFLDLVALAVVADVVPLLDENRYLLKEGLEILANSERPGIQELCKICGIVQAEISEEDIGFQIAPRLNAAGRIINAQIAVELLLTSHQHEAKNLARELDQINSRRKELSEQIYEEAKAQLGKGFANQPIILYQPHWHQGVLGIAASKLCEEYYVPVLLLGLKEDGKTITGSARSITGIHILEALEECAEFLTKYGGHVGAAGLSLAHDRLIGFQKSLEKILLDKLKKLGDKREIRVDGILPLSAVDRKAYFELQKLAPFGAGNPLPIFLCSDVEVVYHRATTNNKHLRLILKEQNIQHPAIWWWGGERELTPRIDLVYSIGLNRWQGREEIQLLVNQVINREVGEEVEKYQVETLEFKIEDWRNWQELGNRLPEFNNPAFYYEGIPRTDFPELINRYRFCTAETLVLLSCPPSFHVLQELIFAIRPTSLILAYSNRELTSNEMFVKRLLGLIKYIVEQKSGRSDIYQLSTLTAELENTVMIALKNFAEQGLIEVEFFGVDEFLLKKGNGQKKSGNLGNKDRLGILLNESRAFRKYLLTSSIKEIKSLLQRSI